jgi:branched-chain amino acid transport system permease protein
MAYLIHLAILICIYAMLGLSLNLVVGYTGLLSVAEAAFYGIGAYVTALLLVNSGWNFFLALLVGMVASGVVALVIGLVLSKFDGDYYALASLGLGVIIYSVFLNWQSVTGGPLGIPGIPRPALFGFAFSDNLSFLILALVFVALIYFVSRFIVNSSFGRVLKTIREDEKAVQVFGYKTLNYKLVIFVIGAMMASVAGSFYAAYITYIDPTTFTVDASIFMIAIIILGGLASLRGSLIGAVFLILLPEFLRFVGFPDEIAAQMRQAVYGLLLILLMLYRPQGLVGEYKL